MVPPFKRLLIVERNWHAHRKNEKKILRKIAVGVSRIRTAYFFMYFASSDCIATDRVDLTMFV